MFNRPNVYGKVLLLSYCDYQQKYAYIIFIISFRVLKTTRQATKTFTLSEKQNKMSTKFVKFKLSFVFFDFFCLVMHTNF